MTDTPDPLDLLGFTERQDILRERHNDASLRGEIDTLRGHRDAIQVRLDALTGERAADEERLRQAGARVGIWYGCDTPDWLAEEILGLRARLDALEAENDKLRGDRFSIERLRMEDAAEHMEHMAIWANAKRQLQAQLATTEAARAALEAEHQRLKAEADRLVFRSGKWLIARKRDTEPWEVLWFDRYGHAAMTFDSMQAQWSTVFFCSVAHCEGHPLDTSPIINAMAQRLTLAESSRASLEAEQAWQPIDTAEKSLEPVLLWVGDRVMKGRWIEAEASLDGWPGYPARWEDCGEGFELKPTHWKPLPLPPSSPSAQETPEKS